MREIPYQAKIEALDLYLQGHSSNEIVNKTGISKGTVVSILGDAREGKFPVPGLKDRVDEFHALAIRLRKETLDVAEAKLGIVFLKRLAELGVEPEKLETWLGFCSEISPSPPEGFLPAAMEFFHLSKEVGKGYTQMLGEVKELSARRDSLAAEVGDLQSKEEKARELNKEIQGAEREVLRLQARRDELRPEVSQLDHLLQRKAAALGVPLAELESRLRELLSLEVEIATGRQERDRFQGEIEALTERERKVSARIEKACGDFRKDLELMKATRRELVEAGQLKGRLEKEIEGMEWSLRVIPFLSDPDKVPDKDSSLIAIVVNCVDKWIGAQPEFRYRTDPGWSYVKRCVPSRRMELRAASQ